MTRICPNPRPWSEAWKHLTRYSEMHKCTPPLPPKPLILSGWAYSNDNEKKDRWEDTIRWATDNGCAELVNFIPDSDYYFVGEPTTHDDGSVDAD